MPDNTVLISIHGAFGPYQAQQAESAEQPRAGNDPSYRHAFAPPITITTNLGTTTFKMSPISGYTPDTYSVTADPVLAGMVDITFGSDTDSFQTNVLTTPSAGTGYYWSTAPELEYRHRAGQWRQGRV